MKAISSAQKTAVLIYIYILGWVEKVKIFDFDFQTIRYRRSMLYFVFCHKFFLIDTRVFMQLWPKGGHKIEKKLKTTKKTLLILKLEFI